MKPPVSCNIRGDLKLGGVCSQQELAFPSGASAEFRPRGRRAFVLVENPFLAASFSHRSFHLRAQQNSLRRGSRCNRPQVGAESPNDIRAIHEILASSGTDHSRLRLERETLTTSASQYPVESGLIRRELTIAIEFAFATSIQIWRVRKLRRLYGLPRYAARNELSLRIADGYDLA